MLLQYGNTSVSSDWAVIEKTPIGYSRVYYVYSGEVEYIDEQQKTTLKANHLYIFPSASAYSMKQNPDNRLVCTFIHIDVFPALITNLVEVSVEDNLIVKHILLSLAASIDAFDIKLVYALSEVFEIYCKEHNLLTSPIKQISKVLIYISEHIESQITITNLSKIAGYNEQYFIRIFKKTVGLTPHQYIISFRLKEAKKLLEKDMSITQIAGKTGYSDIKSFSRSFKAKFSQSPTDFKNDYISQP